MTETQLETVEPAAEAKRVDTKEGRSAHRRYSPVGVAKELRGTTWPTPRQVLGGLLAVVAVGSALAVAVYWADLGISTLVLDLFEGAGAGGSVLVGVLIGVQVLSALAVGYFALRHPSPGDTLASIFGGQITAQGTGTTPRQKRLAWRMGASTAAFFVATLALSYFLG